LQFVTYAKMYSSSLAHVQLTGIFIASRGNGAENPQPTKARRAGGQLGSTRKDFP